MSTDRILPPEAFERPIRLVPHYSVRPWGGDRLARVLGKTLPPEPGGPIGESWELSDHPSGRSLVADGPAAGMAFGDLMRMHPRPMIGRDDAPEKYPLLVKFIDAAEHLSVQVHPDDAWCLANGHDDRGKSECWFIMDCAPDTQVIYGYKPGVTEQQARDALTIGGVVYTGLLDFRSIKPGDFLALPPRTVHAMLAGTLVCEIQQSSNTTFRLYDWDREPRRELHVDQSMAVTEWDSRRLPQIKHFGALQVMLGAMPVRREVLVSNEFFEVTLYETTGRVAKADLVSPSGTILNVVGGAGRLTGPGWDVALHVGQTLYLPAAMPSPALTADTTTGIRLLATVSKEL